MFSCFGGAILALTPVKNELVLRAELVPGERLNLLGEDFLDNKVDLGSAGETIFLLYCSMFILIS